MADILQSVDTDDTSETNADVPFSDVKDQFEFTGFSDNQKDVVLGQLEDVWNTEAGQNMLQAGLDGQGLHYLNLNSEAVMDDIAPTVGARSPADVRGFGNFAIPTRGEVYLNGYDAQDSNGDLEVYTDPSLAGQTADARPPIRSLDADGAVFVVPKIYTLIHETSHTANLVGDLSNTNFATGKYYSGPVVNDPTVEVDYLGPNEEATREILTQLAENNGEDSAQFRGSYTATWLDGRTTGEDLGLGRDYDTTLTTGNFIDMTGHKPQDALTVGVDGRVRSVFQLGDGNDTAYGFGENDTFTLGGGNDVGIGGDGNDTFNAGRGADVYDGGAGFDTIDYSSYVQSNFDQITNPTLGVNITIDDTAANAVKGTSDLASLPLSDQILFRSLNIPMDTEVDILKDIENIQGTARDDVFTIENLSGNMYINGGAGTNTLTVNAPSDAYAIDMAGGTFPIGHPRAGEAYGGTVSNGSETIYLNGFDEANISVGEAQATNPVGDTSENTTEPNVNDNSDSVSLERAAAILQHNMPLVREQASADEALLEVINSPMPVALLNTLQTHGVETLDMSGANINTPEGLVSGVMSAAADAYNPERMPAPDLEALSASQDQTESQDAALHQAHQNTMVDEDTASVF